MNEASRRKRKGNEPVQNAANPFDIGTTNSHFGCAGQTSNCCDEQVHCNKQVHCNNGEKPQINIMRLLELLDERYPDTACFLSYSEPWQLLVATILSAQCTDARVNEVTPKLFERYESPAELAGAELAELTGLIRSTGFFNSKARNIISSMQMLLQEHGGEMPSDIGELTRFPGVGRKTANVVRGHIFNIPSVVVDTHVKRVSGRLGLTQQTDPEKIEFDLMEIIPKDHWIRYNTQIIAHGREICAARLPKCGECILSEICLKNMVDKSKCNKK